MRRCRDDFVHKTSKMLADEGYTIVAFEKLNIANIMVKNHFLAQAIMDVTWGKLLQYTYCLQGREAWRTGYYCQPKGYIAEKLKVWGGCGRKA